MPGVTAPVSRPGQGGEREAARRAPRLPGPPPGGPLTPCPQELPQRLGAEEGSSQDEVEEEEVQPGPGIQSPQHGENHLLLQPLSSGFCLPLPQQEDGTVATRQGHLTKAGHSRAPRRGQKPPAEVRFGFLTLSANRCQNGTLL